MTAIYYNVATIYLRQTSRCSLGEIDYRQFPDMEYSITQKVLTLSPWHLKLHSKRSWYTLSSSTRRQNSIPAIGVMLSQKVFHGETSAVVKQNHRIAADLRVKIIVHKYLHFLFCICNASVCNGLYCKNELTSSWLKILTFLCGQGHHCCNLIFPRGRLTKQICVGISDWNTWIARISEEIMSGSLPLWPCPSLRSRRNFFFCPARDEGYCGYLTKVLLHPSGQACGHSDIHFLVIGWNGDKNVDDESFFISDYWHPAWRTAVWNWNSYPQEKMISILSVPWVSVLTLLQTSFQLFWWFCFNLVCKHTAPLGYFVTWCSLYARVQCKNN